MRLFWLLNECADAVAKVKSILVFQSGSNVVVRRRKPKKPGILLVVSIQVTWNVMLSYE